MGGGVKGGVFHTVPVTLSGQRAQQSRNAMRDPIPLQLHDITQ